MQVPVWCFLFGSVRTRRFPRDQMERITYTQKQQMSRSSLLRRSESSEARSIWHPNFYMLPEKSCRAGRVLAWRFSRVSCSGGHSSCGRLQSFSWFWSSWTVCEALLRYSCRDSLLARFKCDIARVRRISPSGDPSGIGLKSKRCDFLHDRVLHWQQGEI